MPDSLSRQGSPGSTLCREDLCEEASSSRPSLPSREPNRQGRQTLDPKPLQTQLGEHDREWKKTEGWSSEAELASADYW